MRWWTERQQYEKDETGLIKNKQTLRVIKIVYNTIAVLGFAALIAFAIYAWNNDLFDSIDGLRTFMQKSGISGALIFILLQIVQVVVPIMPGGVSILAGVVIFGPWLGFIYNYIGIILGSIVAFLMTRTLGKPFLQTITPKRIYSRYITWLESRKHFDKLFAFAIFMPLAPDDFICMMAGLTKMTLSKFFFIILVCKPFSIAAYSFILEWITRLF